MKYIYILSVLSLSIFFSEIVMAKDKYLPKYKFTATVNNPKSGFIDLTYTNTSSFAHCILASDLAMKLPDDALLVSGESGAGIKYIGPITSLSIYNVREYLILPPGSQTMTSIYLNKYYKIRGEKKVNVSYRIPVIPCLEILDSYVKLPHPLFIKDKVKELSISKTDVFKDNYPEWTEFGFIATMEQLLIER